MQDHLITVFWQELKGNIRVFCRVRPILPDESSTADTKVIAFPTSTETMGRGVDLLQNGRSKYIYNIYFQVKFLCLNH